MKIKEGKKVWYIITLIALIIYVFGIVGSCIVNKNLDAINATNVIVVLLLTINLNNFVEKK